MTDSSSTSLLISNKSLENGHSLSFKNQPYFEQLMRATRAGKRMTLVVGAGVSMDSGLPSWPQLLSAMADQIKDPIIARIANDDSSDQLRKAEYIQSLIMGMTSESPRGMLRRALYPDDSDPKPGELAEAIARLIAVDPSRFQLLTTNFDNMLEQALKGHLTISVNSVALDNYEGESGDGKSFSVVHLHGMVTRNDKPKPLDPVVLTESEFLRNGDRVKSVLRRAMKSSASVVFVGVSLTDPNLVGPLWEIFHSQDPEVKDTEQSVAKYVFSVVSSPTNTFHVEFPVAAKIMRYRAQYNEQFGARPILLKSYSQLVQAFSEMGLCAVEPANYVLTPKHGQSIRYGARLNRAITQAYKAIGAARGQELPRDTANGSALSEALHKALYGGNGLVSLIEKVLREEARIESLGDEKFALFLWLRRRARGKVSAPYGVMLTGSSAYVHREEWSFKRPDEISYNSEWMASRCLFMGGLQITNGTNTTDGIPGSSGKQPPTWNGILARPLILRGFSSPVSSNRDLDGMYDRLVIGSVTLNSTYCMVDDNTKNPDVKLSALAALKASDRLNEVSEKLNAVVLEQVLYQTTRS